MTSTTSEGGATTATAAGAPSAAPIRLVKPDEHTPLTTQTAGMDRREVCQGPGVWIGLTRTQPGNTSDWHHHGEYDTYIYVQTGSARFEFGPGGRGACDAEAGDLLHVPQWSVHRETNPGDAENVLLIVRVGSGEPVFNVEGPAG
jgi:uncharacterized RmlC-like cupin family protein